MKLIPDKLRAWHLPISGTLHPFIVIAGIGGLVFGTRASKAFDTIGGDVPIHVLGAALALGGSLTVAGMLREDALWKLAGYALTAFGCALYGMGALLGLGTYGWITGWVSIGLAVQFIRRVRLQWRTSHRE